MTVVISLMPVFLLGALVVWSAWIDSRPEPEDPWVKEHYPNRADRSLRNWYMERELPPPPPASWDSDPDPAWKGERPSHYVTRKMTGDHPLVPAGSAGWTGGYVDRTTEPY